MNELFGKLHIWYIWKCITKGLSHFFLSKDVYVRIGRVQSTLKSIFFLLLHTKNVNICWLAHVLYIYVLSTRSEIHVKNGVVQVIVEIHKISLWGEGNRLKRKLCEFSGFFSAVKWTVDLISLLYYICEQPYYMYTFIYNYIMTAWWANMSESASSISDVWHLNFFYCEYVFIYMFVSCHH